MSNTNNQITEIPESERMAVADRMMEQLLARRDPNVDQPRVREHAPAKPGIFSIANVRAELLGKGVPYEMPDGNLVYVHALSQRDQQVLLRWGGERRDREQDIRDPLQAQLRAQEITRDVQIYVVILACRDGEDRETSEPIFQKEDFGALRAYLKAGVVDEINRLADDQSGSSETLTSGVRRFFTATQRLSETSLSACATWDGCPDGLRVILTRFGSLASRATKRGAWGSGMMTELNDLLALMG